MGLAQDILSAPLPDGVATRIVAVDGCGGAGKSTLAARLAAELGGVPVVHTDDFASWDNPINWWPVLLEHVLVPLATGREARFTPNSWGGEPREPVIVEPGGTVIVEGVTAARGEFRPYLAYAIWIETTRETRLQRGLERDGEHARPLWERWMAEEDAYVERERPHEHANVVLLGE